MCRETALQMAAHSKLSSLRSSFAAGLDVPANAFYTAKLRECEKITSLEHFINSFHSRPRANDQDRRHFRGTAQPHLPARTLHPLESDERHERPACAGSTRRRAGNGCSATGGDHSPAERGRRPSFFRVLVRPFLGFWTSFEAAAKLGLLCIPGGGLSSEARMQAIIETGATILCCTPTYALRLGGIGTAGSRVRAIIVAGEPGGSIPSTRAQIEALAWRMCLRSSRHDGSRPGELRMP